MSAVCSPSSLKGRLPVLTLKSLFWCHRRNATATMGHTPSARLPCRYSTAKSFVLVKHYTAPLPLSSIACTITSTEAGQWHSHSTFSAVFITFFCFTSSASSCRPKRALQAFTKELAERKPASQVSRSKWSASCSEYLTATCSFAVSIYHLMNTGVSVVYAAW